MEKIEVARLKELLRQNGTYEQFVITLKKNASSFLTHCEGKVEYFMLYDLSCLNMRLSIHVQINFKGKERYSLVGDIKVISLEDYIDQCFERNKDVRDNYNAIINIINNHRKLNR